MKSYDWYGAYETRLNEKDAYKENLNLDYTFDFPAIHENVSVQSPVQRENGDARRSRILPLP